MSGYAEEILIILAINLIVAYAAYLPMAAGQINLGVAGFMAIGAYGAGYLSNEFALPLVVSVLSGGVLAGIFGLAVGFPMLRTRGIYLALATFALGEVVRGTILNMEVVGAAAGYGIDLFAGFEVIVIFTLCVVALIFYLNSTRFGLCLTAVHDDETVADLFGVNVRWTQLLAFAGGAFLAGIGGALFGHHFSYIEAQRFNIMLSIFIVLYVLLGGTQTVWGPIVGALFFTLFPEMLRETDEWRFAIFAAAIILMMVWRPQGVVTSSLLERLPFSRRRWSSGVPYG